MPLDREKLKARLRAVFAGELAEHVSALNRDLLLLEKTEDAAELSSLIQLLFRTAHTLKGAARSVSAVPIERLCHELESVFGALRSKPERPSPGTMQAFFAIADALDAAGRSWADSGTVSDGGHAELIARLSQPGLAGNPAVARPEPLVEKPVLPTGEIPAGDVPLAPPAPAPVPAFPPPPRADGAEPVTREPLATTPPPRPVRRDDPKVPAESSPRPELRQGDLNPAGVRVDAGHLDELMVHAGELLVARRQARTADELLAPLEERLRAARAAVSQVSDRELVAGVAEQLDLLGRDLERVAERQREDRALVDQVAGRLESAVRSACLQPFAEATAGLDRIVRDLERQQGKEVALSIAGGTVALERGVLARLKPALLHLVRNAVDHGIETPAERVAAGKPRGATLTIEAHMRGAQVDVIVTDDGRGIDRERVLAKARAMGVAVPAEEAAHLRLVFHPGLSTATTVTEISGRGVGLDVVNAELAAVHGRIDVWSDRTGTTFKLSLPVSLSTFRVLVVEAAGRAFGLVTSNVERLLRASPRDLTVIQDRPMLVRKDGTLQVAQLAAVLGLAPRGASPEKRPLVVIAAGEDRCALAVDALVAEQEIVLKPLGARLAGVPGVAGAAILPDGRVCLVLTASDLLRQARAADARLAALPEATEAPRHLIVADDSVTTRQLLRGVLEEAGYIVTEAADGQAAFELLEARGADLVVSDVEMPRMDGLTLTRAIRRTEKFRQLPVVLITSLESDAERLRGLEAGATAYLKKSAFEQDALLEALAQLL